jgi:hypothetical protein
MTRFPFHETDPEAEAVARPRQTGPHAPAPDVAAVAPGPELAELLTLIDPADVSDADLVELVDAAVRQAAWAHACAARYTALLDRRASMHPVLGRGRIPEGEKTVTPEEVAMRLAWSRRQGRRLLRQGLAFDRDLGDTGAALARGQIDATRAGVLVDRLAGLPVPVTLDVQEAVLPAAPGRTATQLVGDVDRALITVDPAEAAARRQHARTRRCVERPRALPDGMARLTAVLAAPDATRIHTTLDAAARTARAAGDPRTVDQLRADGLTDLVLHRACAAALPTVTASGGVAAGPGGAGSGDVAAGPGGAGSAFAVPDAGLPGHTTPASAVPASAVPGSAVPDADDTPAPHAVLVDGVVLAGVTAADVEHPGELADETCPSRRRRPTTTVHVTVPFSTLMGVDDQPGELAGYGPVDAATARALAVGGVWRRLVTDPLSGSLLDLGRTRYRPTAALDEHVRTRDRTCVRPGCSAPARCCDVDHTREYHRQPGEPAHTGQADADASPLGTTSVDNLGLLCRRDHLLKTTGGFRLTQLEPGRFRWVTPTGQVSTVEPGRDPAPPPGWSPRQDERFGPPPF